MKIGKEFLSQNEYNYVWSRDKGDGEYTGVLDRIKIDKDEGYEVLYFIQVFMSKHGLRTAGDVKRIEEALHNPRLSAVVMRDVLISEIEELLGL